MSGKNKSAGQMLPARRPKVSDRSPFDPDLLIDQVTDLPTVPLLLEQMRNQLCSHGFLGILSINILQSSGIERVTGWKAFDRIVRDVGRFLASIKTQHLRRDDFISEVMISGNAFLVLLSPPRAGKMMSTDDLQKVRDRLYGKLRRFLWKRLPAEISERFSCFVGASFVMNDPAIRTERLVYRALDEAQADSVTQQHRALEDHRQALSRVITSRLIHSVYQPIVDVFHKRVLGWEALSRPSGNGFDNIEQLFKAAYANDSLWPLERLCRERAMEGLSRLTDGHLLFLNVEPDSINDPQFRSEQTLRLLEQVDLTPDRVVLEMTEHSAVRDFTAFRQTLTYFRSLGFRLAIDDMGSGYSGLTSIAEIQPEFVKIDMSLVRGIHRRAIKQQLVETITRFARDVGIEVVAEGIEEHEELETLKQIGVGLVQGFLFARPASPPPYPDLDAILRPKPRESRIR
ncbi:MAG: EAL domain-containing protein [Acidobacteriota bacterium]